MHDGVLTQELDICTVHLICQMIRLYSAVTYLTYGVEHCGPLIDKHNIYFLSTTSAMALILTQVFLSEENEAMHY
jgi:hypothetical protein